MTQAPVAKTQYTVQTIGGARFSTESNEDTVGAFLAAHSDGELLTFLGKQDGVAAATPKQTGVPLTSICYIKRG